MSTYSTNTDNIESANLFSICNGIWDEKTKKFQQNTLVDQIQCCFNQCDPVQNYCKEKCKTNYKQLFSKEIESGKLSEAKAKTNCDLVCDINHNVCTDTCRLLSPIFQTITSKSSTIDANNYNVYYSCARNYCPLDLNLLPQAKCVKNNAKKILDCCDNNCSPTALKNCSNYCLYEHSFFSDPEKISNKLSVGQDESIYQKETKLSLKDTKLENKPSDTITRSLDPIIKNNGSKNSLKSCIILGVILGVILGILSLIIIYYLRNK